MKVTLHDIAESTGYSVSTVSRVLSGSGRISEKARKTIIESAELLQYPASKIRFSAREKENLHITLITDFHEGEFYSSFFFGFNKAARQENIRLSLISAYKPKDEIVEFTRFVVDEQSSDGIVLFTPELDREDYAVLKEALPDNYPVISNSLIESPVFSTVTFDGYSGGHIAAEHFHQRGYKKAGIIKGPFRKAESRFRYNGFNDFINQSDEMNLVWEFDGDFNFKAGLEAFVDFERQKEKPDAIFVTNDLMCHAFMKQAARRGYRIPEDIAILSYDNLPMCEQNDPAISSIDTDFTRLGLATLSSLKDKIISSSQSQGVLSLIPVSLIPREST